MKDICEEDLYRKIVDMIEKENYRIVKWTSHEGFVMTEYRVYDGDEFIVSLNGNGFDGFTLWEAKKAYWSLEHHTNRKHLSTIDAFESWVKEKVDN